jgi:hypothetical protein
MAQISFKPNKAYPSIPTVGETVESHSRALEAIREALQIHERRTKDHLESFVRVSELVDLGLISLDGTVVEDGGSDQESTSHVHDTVYIRQDGASPATTGVILFGAGIDVAGAIVVSGLVDGRDVNADGATQDAHIADTTIHHGDHTGEVTGVDEALTLDVTSITNRSSIVADAADEVSLKDTTDGTIRKTSLDSITDGGYF